MGTEVYLGMPPPNVVAWIKAERDRKGPLFFEANEPGASVAMLCWDEIYIQPTSIKCHLQYSTDKMATWATYDGSIVYLDDCMDKRVYFRADLNNPNTDGFNIDGCIHYFKTDRSVKAGGNIQFLLESTGTRTDVPSFGFYQLFGYEEYYDAEYGIRVGSCDSLTTAPALPATTLASSCYVNMFRDCSSLTTAPALPATILANYCYYSMFQYCKSLMTAPALPATTLASSCYESMFQGCTSLTSAPALQAETLADSCYSSMFNGCTSLTTAPALPATTLASSCYSSMFRNCSKLASIDVSFSAWNPTNATSNWVNGVAASGTFTCPSTLPDTPRNASHIPSGWTKTDK